MDSKTKLYLIIGAVVIVLFYMVYKWGKKAQEDDNQKQLPSETDWGKSLDSSDNAKVIAYADDISKDINGINLLWSRNASVYVNLNKETDKILVAVYNYFNQKYNKDLIKEMQGEHYNWYSFDLQDTVDNIIKRIQNYS